jgi:rhodanese-related sulfurtransferase
LIFVARKPNLARRGPGVAAALGMMVSGSSGAVTGESRVSLKVQDLTAQEVSQGIADGRYLLIDVREPNEVEAEAYPDAVVVPLSSFDPKQLPDPGGKQVVFACRSGKRSVTASQAAQAAGLAYDKHLAGGILGWKAAGLPTKSGH